MDDRLNLIRSSLVISVALHLAILGGGIGLWPSGKAVRETASKLLWVEVAPDSRRERRVVDSRAGEKAEEAAPNAFLGAETRRVMRETLAKTEAVTTAPAGGGPQTRKDAGGKAPVLSKLGVPLSITTPGSRSPASDRGWTNFSMQYGAVARDYVEGLNPAEQTALNTKEFVFYGYFERIRARLDLAWQPLLREHLIKMYRSGRRLASDRDHTTRTRVVLDSKGRVVRVLLLEASGVVTLDDAAVEAFNQAGPFPNPPKGLISPEGTVEIQWEFVLKT